MMSVMTIQWGIIASGAYWFFIRLFVYGQTLTKFLTKTCFPWSCSQVSWIDLGEIW
jgi:hypothetical protein